VLTSKVGLHIPPTLSFDEWQLAGHRLSGIVDSSCWWLGDWLTYGKDHYSGRYQRGIEEVGLKYQTLRNYAWVARRFPLHRRRAALTFQHHAELASLPAEEQDKWLDRAERGNWTTKQLRTATQLTRRKANNTDSVAEIESMKQLAVPGDRVEWWREAAQHSGTAFEQWVLSTLDQAAELILSADDPAPINT
jgi:hypothetical protein